MALVALTTLFALLVGGSSVASATPVLTNDAYYLSLLRSNGVYIPYSVEPVAIRLGHSIVAYLEMNPTDQGVINVAATGMNAGFSPPDTAVIMFSAVKAYDPALMPVLAQFAKDYGSGPSSANSVDYQLIRCVR
jgi:hypothetical protein